ncbi:MAG: hypothetical protein WBN82_07260 [Porticoccaceae bacterium]
MVKALPAEHIVVTFLLIRRGKVVTFCLQARQVGMMQVSIREFKAHLSAWLAHARTGHTIEVTSHRKVIARIQGVPEAAPASVAELVASGAAQWQGGKPQGADVRLSEAGNLLSELVMQDRA